jgi:hypothetical protein
VHRSGVRLRQHLVLEHSHLPHRCRQRHQIIGWWVPLGPSHEPGAYDMCAEHAEALSAPVGWEVIRLPGIDNPAPDPPADDLMALAAAVREVGMSS